MAVLGGSFDASAFGIDVVIAKGSQLVILEDSLRGLLEEVR
jgi:hypothetical protein